MVLLIPFKLKTKWSLSWQSSPEPSHRLLINFLIYHFQCFLFTAVARLHDKLTVFTKSNIGSCSTPPIQFGPILIRKDKGKGRLAWVSHPPLNVRFKSYCLAPLNLYKSQQLYIRWFHWGYRLSRRMYWKTRLLSKLKHRYLVKQ